MVGAPSVSGKSGNGSLQLWHWLLVSGFFAPQFGHTIIFIASGGLKHMVFS